MLLLALFLVAICAYRPGDDVPVFHRVRMDHLRMLEFTRDERAISKHGAGPMQLECVGGRAWFDRYRLDKALCTRQENDWVCETEVVHGYTISNVKVVCEGYDSPNDAFVVDGSCNMQYEIEHNEERKPHNMNAFIGLMATAFLLLVSLLAALCSSVVVVSLLHRHKKPYDPDLTKVVFADS